MPKITSQRRRTSRVRLRRSEGGAGCPALTDIIIRRTVGAASVAPYSFRATAVSLAMFCSNIRPRCKSRMPSLRHSCNWRLTLSRAAPTNTPSCACVALPKQHFAGIEVPGLAKRRDPLQLVGAEIREHRIHLQNNRKFGLFGHCNAIQQMPEISSRRLPCAKCVISHIALQDPRIIVGGFEPPPLSGIDLKKRHSNKGLAGQRPGQTRRRLPV
jgi:hypothetical protein